MSAWQLLMTECPTLNWVSATIILVEFTWYLHMTVPKSYRWSETYAVPGHLQPASGICMIIAYNLAPMSYHGICNHDFDPGQIVPVIQCFMFVFIWLMGSGLGGRMWSWGCGIEMLTHWDSVTFLWLWAMSTLAQILICHSFDTKPLSD